MHFSITTLSGAILQAVFDSEGNRVDNRNRLTPLREAISKTEADMKVPVHDPKLFVNKVLLWILNFLAAGHCIRSLSKYRYRISDCVGALGIREILVRIRIHGSVPLTNGSVSRSVSFLQ
jgi:hypothetical protein